jgi:hypothetical protein
MGIKKGEGVVAKADGEGADLVDVDNQEPEGVDVRRLGCQVMDRLVVRIQCTECGPDRQRSARNCKTHQVHSSQAWFPLTILFFTRNIPVSGTAHNSYRAAPT